MLAAAIGLAGGCDRLSGQTEAKGKEKKPAVAVLAAPVVQKSVPVELRTFGTVEPNFMVAVKAQVTVEDGDMVAIGGIISESKTESSSGIPILYKIPLVGAIFGSKSTTSNRTEMVIFLTPHVIYDTTGLAEASDDLVRGMKRVQKLVRE